MPLPPPLLVSPVDHLTAEDRAKFQDNVTEIARAKPGDVITCTFPVAMYHRIDGIWLPVSDLGAFHAPATGTEAVKDVVESSYVPPQFVVDND
ncbi:MAG: hypothetical protein P4L67_04920 [Candidatus Pacebacteria bacterium]|nr:hypothetical protein [Candidatus Paceibacterota bacterium]